MKTKFLILGAILATVPFTKSFADDGGDLFKANCGVCHTVGKGKLVGPDLKGVETRHSESWLLKWVKSSQTLVQSGDKEAIKLFTDNSSIPMPDQALNEDQIKSVLAYIKTGGEPVMAATDPVSTGPDAITVAMQKSTADKKDSGSLLTLFSFSEYLMMFLMGILLIIIYILSLSIKTLTEKIKEANKA
jgi:mono/diheme cytochrome c family protein